MPASRTQDYRRQSAAAAAGRGSRSRRRWRAIDARNRRPLAGHFHPVAAGAAKGRRHGDRRPAALARALPRYRLPRRRRRGRSAAPAANSPPSAASPTPSSFSAPSPTIRRRRRFLSAVRFSRCRFAASPIRSRASASSTQRPLGGACRRWRASRAARADAVLDGETGILCRGDDEREVFEALDQLLSDEALRSRLGEAARRHALNHLGWNSALPRYLAALGL